MSTYDDRGEGVDRSLRQLLQAADALPAVRGGTEPAETAEDYAQIPEEARDAPKNGTIAYRNIQKFGEGYAKYLEHVGDATLAESVEYAEHLQRVGADVVTEAQSYRDGCYREAALVRQQALDEATRAVRYVKRVERLGMQLQEAARQREEEP